MSTNFSAKFLRRTSLLKEATLIGSQRDIWSWLFCLFWWVFCTESFSWQARRCDNRTMDFKWWLLHFWRQPFSATNWFSILPAIYIFQRCLRPLFFSIVRNRMSTRERVLSLSSCNAPSIGHLYFGCGLHGMYFVCCFKWWETYDVQCWSTRCI